VRRSRGFIAGLLLFVAGCAPRAVYHQLQVGDTLDRIRRAYGVKHQDLRVASVTTREARLRRDQLDERMPRFEWPVPDGVVTSGFGKRNRKFHDGIDISAAVGTGVYAAAGGEVVYSGALRGYGNVIILRHGDGYTTVYAHNQNNYVRERQWVRRGDLIATVGRTGRTTGPNLHFEIRKDDVARNPLYLLPPSAANETAFGAR
jgi:murein DD-endopeptidase MepM/ murein hydrolase activator NlpD